MCCETKTHASKLSGMAPPVELFAADVAGNYAKYRRGYRPDLISHLAASFALGPRSRVLDLGCGTGQLAIPLAAEAGAVIGMDPSADMLTLADTAAANVTWVLGSDEQVPGLESLLGKESFDLVTIGQALHWMDAPALFAALAPLLRPNGGIAVISNGTPVWTQETAWGRALAEVADQWFTGLTFPTCGCSPSDRARYRRLFTDAGYTVKEHAIDYSEELTMDEVIGSFYSATPLDRLDDEQRVGFDAALRAAQAAAQPDGRFVEEVPVHMLIACRGH
jgi:ubiquinone/menaquinone biosynthesis C-methylase UbiE